MTTNAPPEPHFQAHLQRVRTGTSLLCFAAVPIGVYLHNPVVWGLGVLGLVVHAARWHRHGPGYFG